LITRTYISDRLRVGVESLDRSGSALQTSSERRQLIFRPHRGLDVTKPSNKVSNLLRSSRIGATEAGQRYPGFGRRDFRIPRLGNANPCRGCWHSRSQTEKSWIRSPSRHSQVYRVRSFLCAGRQIARHPRLGPTHPSTLLAEHQALPDSSNTSRLSQWDRGESYRKSIRPGISIVVFRHGNMPLLCNLEISQ
jgi:hypothetical protein